MIPFMTESKSFSIIDGILEEKELNAIEVEDPPRVSPKGEHTLQSLLIIDHPHNRLVSMPLNSAEKIGDGVMMAEIPFTMP